MGTHRLTLSILVLFLYRFSALAQRNEWLATLDYSVPVLSRIEQIPGVTWLPADNSTFDQNGQRFFFQGGLNRSGPFSLFTLDAVTGNIIYQVTASPATGTSIAGLQFDNGNNILYGIYLNNGQASFCSIDPATGNKQLIRVIPGYLGYNQSAYNTVDHAYITSNGPGLLVLDSYTGQIIYDYPNIHLIDIFFDNKTQLLYGIVTAPSPLFVSVDLSSGTINVLSNLPPLSFPTLFAYGIDENAGKYIFVGSDPPGNPCLKNHLFTLDVKTGAILSESLYVYADDTQDPNAENLIEFGFDNIRGKVYGLNWFPPDNPAVPVITISANPNPVCAGAKAEFIATGTNLLNPSYAWRVNNQPVGIDSAAYVTNTLTDGDIITCIVINSVACKPDKPDTSNLITMKVNPIINATVQILSSATTVCSGDPVLFSATTTNEGDLPVFQWKVNEEIVKTGNNKFVSSSINNGDSIVCKLISNIACAAPVYSNAITMNILETPEVFAGNDTVVAPGQSLLLQPIVKGMITGFLWSPANYLDNPAIEDPLFTAGSSSDFQLLVTGANGCQASDNINIEVYRGLEMPNAFTPNGDQLNDVFRIPPSTPQKIIFFYVYNRWGQLVFKGSGNGSGWDGTLNGKPQPPDVYTWQIEYENPIARKTMLAKGTVTLIR